MLSQVCLSFHGEGGGGGGNPASASRSFSSLWSQVLSGGGGDPSPVTGPAWGMYPSEDRGTPPPQPG